MNRTFFAGLLCVFAGVTGCRAQGDSMKSVGADEFEASMALPNTFLLDVRTPQEYAEGHIAGAVNIDVKADDFVSRALAVIPKDMIVALYCRSGNRSKTASDHMVKNGYKVVELATGINGWTAAGKAVSNDETDAFLTSGGKSVRLYCIKHGSLRMDIDGKRYYVDPVGKGAQPETDYSLLPKADVILITHEHGDHLDPDAIAQLETAGTKIIANPASRQKLGRGQAMNTREELDLDGGVKVKAVPAYNFTEGHQNFHPKGRDNGYLLAIDGFTIYIAGDTEDIQELQDLPKGIDVAFLPCNQPYTMTPAQLASAAKTIRPKVLFPYHYGNTDLSQVEQLLDGSGVEVRIRQYR